MRIMFRAISVILLFCCVTTLEVRSALAVKIVAVVNNDVITDVDVDDFEKVLCKLDKRFECGSQGSRQVAMITFAESLLKLEHFRQIKIINDKQLLAEFKNYKKSVLNSLKLTEGMVPYVFEEYLLAEYLWSVMLSIRTADKAITDKDIANFRSLYPNITGTDEHIRQKILQNRMTDASQSMISELKTLYLVDIKGL